MDEPKIHIDYKTLVDICDKGGLELFKLQAYFSTKLTKSANITSWMTEHIMDLTMADRVKYLACLFQANEVAEDIMNKYCREA